MPLEKGKPKWFEYIVDNYGREEVIGIDQKLITYCMLGFIQRMGRKG